MCSRSSARISTGTKSVPLVIRPAVPGDAGALSALAENSKRHWGYSDSFIAATRHDIVVSAEQISRSDCFVAEQDGAPVGFYLLDADELIRMFVAPDRLGQGIGRKLMGHVTDTARERDISVVTIVSDPNAAGFYEACGASLAGEFHSKDIPGRRLPILELAIGPSD